MGTVQGQAKKGKIGSWMEIEAREVGYVTEEVFMIFVNWCMLFAHHLALIFVPCYNCY